MKTDTSAEEDEIVKEIDVYLTNDENNKYYIFQYPLRPPWRNINFKFLSGLW